MSYKYLLSLVAALGVIAAATLWITTPVKIKPRTNNQGPQGVFLNGSWQASGREAGGLSWSLNYTFKNDQYELDGYPALSQKGTYQIIKQESIAKGVKMILIFTPNNEPPKPAEEVVLLPDQSLVFANGQVFTKK